jgi:hypothetical protein
MAAAIAAAALRSTHKILILSTLSSQSHPSLPPNFTLDPPIPLPESHGAALLIAHRR